MSIEVRHPNRANGYRRKRRSCGTCKPNKVGGAHQFTEKERQKRVRGVTYTP